MPNRNRWCLSAVFVAPFPVDAERLRETVRTIIARHDALRIRWDVDRDGSRQCVGAAVPADVLVVESDARSDQAMCDAEDRLADRLMDTLGLATEIGRAWCRERGFEYVWIVGVAGILN